MKYKKGDTVAYLLDGDVRVSNVWKIRKDSLGDYYHLADDFKLIDLEVIGHLDPVDGKFIINDIYIDFLESEIAEYQNTLDFVKNYAKGW